MIKAPLTESERTERNKKAEKANRIIKPWIMYKVKFITPAGNAYEARYHRSRYWFDDEPVTFKQTNQLKRTWHVDYWKTYPNCGAVQISCNSIADILFGTKYTVTKQVKLWLERLALNHEEIINNYGD